MKRYIQTIIFLTLTLLCKAQSVADPVMVGVYTANMSSSRTSLITQQSATIMLGGEYEVGKKYIDVTTKYLNTYNQYLDLIQNYVGAICRLYGIWIEGENLYNKISFLEQQIKAAPANLVAVGLKDIISSSRGIYQDCGITAAKLCVDLSDICGLTSAGRKMNQAERHRVLLSIEPQIALLSKKIYKLALMVKYTTLESVWRELLNEEYRVLQRDPGIAGEVYRRWAIRMAAVNQKYTHQLPAGVEGFEKQPYESPDKSFLDKADEFLNH